MRFCSVPCIGVTAKVLAVMSDERAPEDQRQAIRYWMLEVKRRTGWSGRVWAAKAKTSPSNITRFLKNDDASMPTWQTMAKLAKVAPVPPPAVQPVQIADERSRWLEFYEAVPLSRRADVMTAVSDIIKLVAGEEIVPKVEEPPPAKRGRR